MSTTFKNISRETGFTQVKNEFLRNPNVSLRAKGLLSLLLSYSGEWNLNCKWTIQNQVKEGKQAFYNTLRELKELGYVVYRVEKDENGRISQHVYEYSDSLLCPHPAFGDLDKQDNKNTKEKNTKNIYSRENEDERLKSEEGRIPSPISLKENKERTLTTGPLNVTLKDLLNNQDLTLPSPSQIEKARLYINTEIEDEMPKVKNAKYATQLTLREKQNLCLDEVIAKTPTYETTDGTARLYCKGFSVQNLQEEVRDILFQGQVKFDLRSAQLCILSKLWEVPELAKYDNLWKELLLETGLENTKANLKLLKNTVYAACYGSTWTTRRNEIAKNLGIDLKTANRILRSPLIERLFRASQKAFLALLEKDGITDALGIERGFKKASRVTKDHRSAMAAWAQSFEILILFPALKYLIDQGVKVTAFLHDGFYVESISEEQRAQIIRLVDEQCKVLSIPTRLEMEVIQ